MSSASRQPLLISIVISNYNYGDFLKAAIDSALGLHWPHLEVIVVDDGSTDNSREIIATYGNSITSVLQDNAGRVNACNVGFARSRGEAVVFLDSDDLLHPNLVREAMAVWSPYLSKVQCQMLTVDAAGRPLGAILPQFKVQPTAERIRRWVSTTGAYPTPPGSGNIYSRWFLQKIFPLDEAVWDATDSCCLAAAPYLGDVETLRKPLVFYRLHGRNDSQMKDLDPTIAARDIRRAQQRFAFARGLASSENIEVSESAVYRSLAFAGSRIVSYKFARNQHPIQDDTCSRIIYDAICAGFTPQGVTLKASSVLVVWIILVGLAPKPIASTLVSWRVIPSSRPQSLKALLHWSGSQSRAR